MRTLVNILAVLALVACQSAPKKLDSCVAIKTRSAPAKPGVARIWGDSFWRNGSTLSVAFVDGTRAQQERAWRRFQKIDNIVGVQFVKARPGQRSDLRVAFAQDDGHWSYVGTGNRSIPQNRATMNLALEGGIWGDTISEWNRVALHEICHALGMQHEHQHPLATIQWDEEKVIDYYSRTQGWSEAEIRFQVLDRAPMTPRFRGTQFDPASLMEYPVPKELTRNGFSVGWNKRLSPLDIAFLRETYP